MLRMIVHSSAKLFRGSRQIESALEIILKVENHISKLSAGKAGVNVEKEWDLVIDGAIYGAKVHNSGILY